MKRFLLHTCLFLILLLLGFFAVFASADGTTDAFYKKMASPRQSSLIVGSSRAAQGIRPSIVDSVYGSSNLYNYAFTIIQTPYGEAYYNSISKKLDKTTKNGVFIVEVNPWTISEYKSSSQSQGYREDDTFIANTHFVNLNPNIEYLLESFNEKNEAILRNKNRKGFYQTFFVHDNGWLEVTVESDMISKSVRTKNKIKSYRKKLLNYKGFSTYRMEYLTKTIDFLKAHGDVYLVRLPVIDDMLAIENELMANFDQKMQAVAEHKNLVYINMITANKSYDYTDGQHLTVDSATRFSKDLAEQMAKSKN